MLYCFFTSPGYGFQDGLSSPFEHQKTKFFISMRIYVQCILWSTISQYWLTTEFKARMFENSFCFHRNVFFFWAIKTTVDEVNALKTEQCKMFLTILYQHPKHTFSTIFEQNSPYLSSVFFIISRAYLALFLSTRDFIQQS